MITTEERNAYLGVYQAYAWQQGYKGKVEVFRLPDEYFQMAGPDDVVFEGFDLKKFMEAVADIDNEGAIHYWKYFEEDGDKFLALGCTEDDSLNDQDLDGADDWYHASHWL